MLGRKPWEVGYVVRIRWWFPGEGILLVVVDRRRDWRDEVGNVKVRGVGRLIS